MIEWIFFDLGSTLLDEEAAYGYYIDKCVEVRVSGYRGFIRFL